MQLEELMKLVDEYAEMRHKTGDWTYSQNTDLKRDELQSVLRGLLYELEMFEAEEYNRQQGD